MSEQRGGADNERYDRDLLLYGSKRDQVLDLWEVKRYGSDTFGDPDAISVYGMTPDDWFARGIRLLGRTVVECTRDVLAREIAADVATVAQTSSSVPLVLDPFVGSANTLYWIQQRLPTSPAIGVDLDGAICELTKRNLDVVQSRIDLLNLDYAAGLDRVAVQTSQPIVVYVAPPWGHALDPEVGLDLSRSEPPVAHVVNDLLSHFPDNPLLVATQAFERMDERSLAEVAALFDWSELHVYDLNPPGRNPGLLLGTKGWPSP